MANAFQIKNDVVNELRNRIYYNQLEIQRLLNNSPQTSHKAVVDSVISLLKSNVINMNSIDLIESYFVPQTQSASTTPDVNVKKEDLEVKNV